jgi:ABC-2 type transport system permease protein
MRLYRVRAVATHAWYHLRHSTETWTDIVWFPVINVLVFSWFATFLAASTDRMYATQFLAGLILWFAIEAGSYSIAVGTLWEVWSRSFSTIFISPLTLTEFVAGQILFAVFKQVLVVAVASLIAYLVFSFSIFTIGALLPLYVLLLMMFGWATGMFVLGLILRLGSNIQSFAWGFIYITQPFIGIYYPVEVLPRLAQKISYALPPTYVYGSMRRSLMGQPVVWEHIWIAVGLDVLYFALAYLFMRTMWSWARRTGALARMEQ